MLFAGRPAPHSGNVGNVPDEGGYHPESGGDVEHSEVVPIQEIRRYPADQSRKDEQRQDLERPGFGAPDRFGAPQWAAMTRVETMSVISVKPPTNVRCRATIS